MPSDLVTIVGQRTVRQIASFLLSLTLGGYVAAVVFNLFDGEGLPGALWTFDNQRGARLLVWCVCGAVVLVAFAAAKRSHRSRTPRER